ncbi:protein MIGRI [Andreprevotia chitinilytica]|uniref:protein MIGRI n=1 Tax=Andreprevotia chitinilytica TaxID=396808 RepID=UPI0012EC64BB|nr:hypothetical protein [Andreprevotia chitinilytica]
MIAKLLRLLPWLLLGWLLWRAISSQTRSNIDYGIRVAAVVLLTSAAGALAWHLLR